METVKAVVFNKHGIGNLVRVRRFPKAGETVRALEWHFGQDAGKGTNVAVALGRLGIRNAFVCTVGDDEGGRLGAQWMGEAGVDLTHYRMCREVTTDTGLVITQSNGENMIIGSQEHACRTSRAELFAAIDDYPEARFFLSGLEIDGQLPVEGCRYAKSRAMTTLLNASPLSGELQPLDCVDYLFVNEIEGAELAGDCGAAADSGQIAGTVRRRYGPGTVVMTLGARGCILCGPEGTRHLPSYDVACVDSIAAGDGFMAAFAAGLAWGMTSVAAADWANRYSAVMVSRKGAILSYPTTEEVWRLSSDYTIRRTHEGGGADVL